MRLIGIIAGVVLIVAGYIYVQQNQPAAPQHLTSSEDVKAYQLANGMKVLVQQDDRADVVVTQVWYKVGSSYEPEGKTGMSHVLEHMMFKGTPDHPAGKFSEIIALNGGQENAFTSKDYTAYFQRIANDRLELCLQLEADRMSNLLLDEAEFKKEVEVVKEERRLRTEDNPTSLTYEKFNAAAFASGAYHHPIIGWMDDLNSLTAQDLKAWYKQWYAPNNATLVVSGNVQAAEVARLANQYFGNIKAVPLPAAAEDAEPAQTAMREIKVKLPAKIPYLMLGYKVPSLNQATDDITQNDVYALEVLSGLLDGGNSARLTKNLVRGSQIASGANADYNPSDRLNTLFVLSGLPAATSSIAELRQALFSEIDSIKNEAPQQSELDRVKAQVIASKVYEKDSIFYQAMQLGILETIGLGWEKKDEYLDKISAITPAQVQAVAQKYFNQNNLTVAELVPLALEQTSAPATDAAGDQHAN